MVRLATSAEGIEAHKHARTASLAFLLAACGDGEVPAASCFSTKLRHLGDSCTTPSGRALTDQAAE